VLLDSGALVYYRLHLGCVKRKFTTRKLEHPIEVYNIDKVLIEEGSITGGGHSYYHTKKHKEHAVFEGV